MLAGMGIVRRVGRDDFDEDDVALLARLTPHLTRALQIHTRFAALNGERDAAIDALDWLPTGVILLDREGRIVTMNRGAEEIIGLADGLAAGMGVLRAARASEAAVLSRMIGDAAATGSGEGFDPGGAMAVSRPSMLRPFSALVAPLGGEVPRVGARRPVVAVFVADPESEDETPEALLARLYGLTPAEARLASALIQGNGLERTAERLGVSINTARTHVKSVFAKTGVNRQTELIRLVLSGPAGLRLP